MLDSLDKMVSPVRVWFLDTEGADLVSVHCMSNTLPLQQVIFRGYGADIL